MNRISTRNIPQQERSRQRRQRILVVAAELYYRSGYDVVTTNVIADAAGVPIGSVYRYFATKEDILGAIAELYAEAASRLIAEMCGRWTAAALSNRQLAEFMAVSVVEFCRSNPLAGQLLVDDFHPAIARAGLQVRRIFIDGFTHFLEPRIDVSRDCSQVALTSFDAIRSIIWRYLQSQPSEQMAILRETSNLLTRYLTGPDPEK